jgi:AcrR family transcriptional regulator
MNRFEKRKGETRARILDTARRIIAERGGRDLSMEEVCARADISRATLYNHFDGRESLLDAVLGLMYEECAAEIGRLSGDPDGVTIAGISSLCVRLWEGHRELFGLFEADSRLAGKGRVGDTHDLLMESFMDLFARLPGQERLRLGDPRETGMLVYRTFTPLLDALEERETYRDLFTDIVSSIVYTDQRRSTQIRGTGGVSSASRGGRRKG